MIEKEAIEKSSRLAQLQLSAVEQETLGKQLSAIIEAFEKVSEVNTEGVVPLVTPTDMEQVWRADESHTWDDFSRALDNAPERSGNLFKVPPVV